MFREIVQRARDRAEVAVEGQHEGANMGVSTQAEADYLHARDGAPEQLRESMPGQPSALDMATHAAHRREQPRASGGAGRQALSAARHAWFSFAVADLYAGVFRWDPSQEPPLDWSDLSVLAEDLAQILRPGVEAHRAEGDRQRWLLATQVLEGARSGGCGTADPDSNVQREALDRALQLHGPRLRQAVGMDRPSPAGDLPAQEVNPGSGLLRWNHELAEYLEQLGDEGKAAATKAREEARDPKQLDWTDAEQRPARALWGLWGLRADGAPRAWYLLGWALWFDVVRSEVVQNKAKQDAARRGLVRAIRSGVATQLGEFSPGSQVEPVTGDGGQLMLRFRSGGSALLSPGLGMDMTPLLADLDTLGQINMARVIVAVAHHATEDWARFLAGDSSAGTLRTRLRSGRDVGRFVAAAWDDMDESRIRTEARKAMVAALDHGSAILLPNPTDPTLRPIRLWELEQRRRGNRVERLLTPLAALTPSDAFRDFDGTGKALRGARRLVPLPRRMPSNIGFAGDLRGPVVIAFMFRVLPEVRRRAWEYATQGLDCESIVRSAFDRAGLAEHGGKAWRAWISGAEPDFVPLKQSAQRWTLNPAKHGDAHRMLLEAARGEKPKRLRPGKARKD